MATAREVLAGSAKDEVGDKKLAKALNIVQVARVGGHPFRSDDFAEVLRLLASALELWGQKRREENASEATTLFAMIGDIQTTWGTAIATRCATTINDGLVEIIAAIERLMPNTGGAEQDETLRTKAADRLEGMLELLEADIAVEVLTLSGLAAYADEAQTSAEKLLANASVSFVADGRIISQKQDLAAVVEGINHQKQVLRASRCLLENMADMPYSQLLSAWAHWRGMPQDAREEIATPALKLMHRGAESVRSLRAWLVVHPPQEPSATSEPSDAKALLIAFIIVGKRIMDEVYRAAAQEDGRCVSGLLRQVARADARHAGRRCRSPDGRHEALGRGRPDAHVWLLRWWRPLGDLRDLAQHCQRRSARAWRHDAPGTAVAPHRRCGGGPWVLEPDRQ